MTKKEREKYLQKRLFEMQEFERELHLQGIKYIGGVDEAGRGPLAGPVVAACVVLPQDFDVLGVDDSKKLTEKKREILYDKIVEKAIAYGVGMEDADVIDSINILQATKSAMRKAVVKANNMLAEKNPGAVRFVRVDKSDVAAGEAISIEHLLIDAIKLENFNVSQTAIVKGDSKSLSIAAASIIAKVYRDRVMVNYAAKYPGYLFEKNKGYGTKAHYDGIEENGITPIHRRSFLKKFRDHHGTIMGKSDDKI